MNLDQLPVNLFDLVVIVVVIAGIARGRKHGMSEELLSLLKWLAILFGCAVIYEPAGLMVGAFSGMFGRLSCFLLAYVGGALLVLLLFAGIKRALDGKLLGSLGVHEHWNNATDKKYSRNLGKDAGIELVEARLA